MLPVESLTARLLQLSRSPRLRCRIFATVHHGQAEFPLWACSWGEPALPAVFVIAGIHGNEPVGVEASLILLENLADGAAPLARHSLVVLPCLNPSGLAAGTRVNGGNQDINRQFHGDLTQESAAVRRFLDVERAEALVDLHTDPNTHGFYFFELRQEGVSALADRIQDALTGAGFPLEEEPFFAGYVGHHGLFATTNAALEEFHKRAPGLSLAEWGWSKGVPRTYSFETPLHQTYERRTAMHVTALLALFAALEAE